jgi:hypothetical protein
MINLYTAQTPNGCKVPIALEKIMLKYTFQALELFHDEQ